MHSAYHGGAKICYIANGFWELAIDSKSFAEQSFPREMSDGSTELRVASIQSGGADGIIDRGGAVIR